MRRLFSLRVKIFVTIVVVAQNLDRDFLASLNAGKAFDTFALMSDGAATGIASGLFVPLRARGRVVGVLVALSGEPAHFTPARERLLAGLAEQATLAFEHSREVGAREHAQQALREAGYTLEALIAASPLAIVAAGHAGPIDLLLTDVVMPVMGGRELAERLKEQRLETAVLFMSDHTDDAVVGAPLAAPGALAAGAPFLQKPFNPASLNRKVREALDAARTPSART